MPNLKNKKVIKDQQGQRKYPGRVTEIQGNTMATTGYGDIPLYVVPNVGNPMVVPADSGNRVFPGASSFTEYPIAKNGGWLEKYQVGGKKLDTSNWEQSSLDSLKLYNKWNVPLKPGEAKRPLTQEEKKFYKDEKTGISPISMTYKISSPNVWGYAGNFQKPVGVQKKKKEPVKKERIDIYTDKALFDKAFAAESDSLNLYNNAKNDINKYYKLEDRFSTHMSDAKWQKTSDEYNKLFDLLEKKWHTFPYKNGDISKYIPGYTENYKYKGPKSGLIIKPVGLQGYREGYGFPRFKKPVVHNVYQEPELEPVKTQAVNILNPIDKDRTEVNFGQKYKTYVYKGEKNPKYKDPTTGKDLDPDISKSFDAKGNYNPVYLEKKEYGGWLEQYGDGGKTLEQKINKALGDPRKKAADAAINKKWFNKETKKWEVEDDTDNFRHPMAARYTAEAIANKFPDWMKYSGIPQVAGFVGSTALGVGHELANNKYTSNDPKDYPNYTFWDTVSEAGEDAFNNIVGAGVGVLPISDDKKTAYLKYLSDNNILPDGLANKKTNMYFKRNGGLIDTYGDNPKAQVGKALKEYENDKDPISHLKWGKYIDDPKRREQHIIDVYQYLMDSNWEPNSIVDFMKKNGSYGSKNRGDLAKKGADWGWDSEDINNEVLGKAWDDYYNNRTVYDKKEYGGWLNKYQDGGYVVNSGDNLSTIAKNNNTDIATLQSLNNIKDINRISIGQNLILPKKQVNINNTNVNTAEIKDLNSYSFNEAFKIARKQLGANKIFEHNGKKFGTNLAGEKFVPDQEELAKNNMLNDAVVNHLNDQNKKVESVYTTKNTVKLQPTWKENTEIDAQNQEFNKLKNAELINKYQSLASPNEKYIIVDKKKGKMHVYLGGKEIESYNVGTGENKGDEQTRTWVDKKTHKTDWSKGNKQTGAGIYTISFIDEHNKHYSNAPSFHLKNESGTEVPTAIHAGFGDRLRRIANNDVKNNDPKSGEDTRFSNGCINGLCKDMTDLYKNDLKQDRDKNTGTKVFILPDDDSNYFSVKNNKLNFTTSGKYNQTTAYSPKNLNASPIKIKVLNKDFETKEVKNMAKTLEDNKSQIMKDANIDNDTYNRLSKMAISLSLQETKGGTDYNIRIGGHGIPGTNKEEQQGLVSGLKNANALLTKYKKDPMSSVKDFAAFSFFGTTPLITEKTSINSKGMTQIKYDAQNKELVSQFKKYGITKDNLNQGKNAAIATVLMLSYMHNNELPSLKEKIKKMNISDEEALLYLNQGKKSEIVNGTATPKKNMYINNIKKYSNQISLKQQSY